jgi:hypothetical protein
MENITTKNFIAAINDAKEIKNEDLKNATITDIKQQIVSINEHFSAVFINKYENAKKLQTSLHEHFYKYGFYEAEDISTILADVEQNVFPDLLKLTFSSDDILFDISTSGDCIILQTNNYTMQIEELVMTDYDAFEELIIRHIVNTSSEMLDTTKNEFYFGLYNIFFTYFSQFI